jgi:hypothetical protein
MDQIRLVILKFIQILLIASLAPIITLLVLSAFNAKVRRFMLWLMIPTATVAVVSYVAFAWVPTGVIRNWQDALNHLYHTLGAALPFVLLLLILGIAAFLFVPPGINALREKRKLAYRRQYLQDVFRWVKPQLRDFVPLDGRTFSASTPYLRMIGPTGSGKSMLLRALLADLARNALDDDTQPLPVLIDIDQLPQAQVGPERILSALLPANAANAAYVLQLESRARRIALLIDTSAQTFAPAFTTTAQRKKILDDLVNIIEVFDPLRLVVALPPGIESGALERLAASMLVIEPSTPIWIPDAVRALGGPKAGIAVSTLLDPGSGWSGLASRMMILSAISRYTAQQGLVPANAKSLFRAMLYPAQPEPEQLETALRALAYEMVQHGQSALSREAAAILLRPFSPAVMVNTGLLFRQQHTEQLTFTHPVFLAYFAALAWEAGQPFQQEILSNTNSDPILALAIVFFNNIVGKSERLASMVQNLNSRPDPGAQHLAAQCLLALPTRERPALLVQNTAARLVSQLALDPQSAQLAWQLLESVDQAARVSVFEHALGRLELAQQSPILIKIFEHSQEDARALLLNASPETARTAGEVFAHAKPREMVQLFRECYLKGPAARQILFIELMGFLPGEACGAFLGELYKSQADAQMRIAILRSMANAGVEMVMILLAVIADPQETADVRAAAAQLLVNSDSPELQSSPVIREVVRISRMPLPERAREYTFTLVERMRNHPSAKQVNHWETLLNPYQPGRPLTERGLFFGREKVIRGLRSALENGTHILLNGEQQSGKTTVLRQFALDLADEAAHAVPVRAAYLSLEGLQPQEFYETVIRSLIESANDPQLVADGQVARPYNDAQFELDLGDLGNYLKAALGSGVRVALLLDDADIFLEYPTVIHAGLRRILGSPAGRLISVILAGCSLLDGWRQAQLPFYSTFQTIALGRLAKEDAICLAARPVEGTYQYDPEALELIAQFTQGRPSEIQAFCHAQINTLIERGERVVTARMVREMIKGQDRVRAELIGESERLLDGMVDWLEAHPESSQPEVEEFLKQTWENIGKIMLRSVKQLRRH